MRTLLTAIVTALEAIAIALASFSAIVTGALFMWLIPLKMSVAPLSMLRAVAKVWGLTHGVPIPFDLEDNESVFMGVAGVEPFYVSLLPLGLSFLTVWFAARVGMRAPAHPLRGTFVVLTSAGGFFVAAFAILFLAGDLKSLPRIVDTLIATLWFIIPAAIAFIFQQKEALLQFARGPAPHYIFQTILPRAVKLMLATTATIIGLASITVALRIFIKYPEMMRLGQMLQLDFLGEILIFVLHLAYLPTVIVWTVSWFSGAGFFIGTGSEVSPFASLLGPLPNIPTLALVPADAGSWGSLALLVPFLAALFIGFTFGMLPEYANPKTHTTFLSILAAAVILGAAFLLLASLTTGSIGPGRMTDLGINGIKFAGLITLETLLGMAGGFALKKYGLREPTDGVETTELEEIAETLRIADPRGEAGAPWFRRRDRSTKPAPETTEHYEEPKTEEELVEEYSWEALIKERKEAENEEKLTNDDKPESVGEPEK